jgi:hypothetical protein
MAQKATTIFSGLMRKATDFRTKLKTELGDKIREFAPTDAEIVYYCERWLEQVKSDRTIGMGGDRYVDDACPYGGDDIQVTDREMIAKMMAFLDEDGAVKELYEQIHTHRNPTVAVVNNCAHYFDEAYGSEIPVYLNDIFKQAGGDNGMYFGKEGEWLLMLLKDEVEKVIIATMKEHLSSKL